MSHVALIPIPPPSPCHETQKLTTSKSKRTQYVLRLLRQWRWRISWWWRVRPVSCNSCNSFPSLPPLRILRLHGPLILSEHALFGSPHAHAYALLPTFSFAHSLAMAVAGAWTRLNSVCLPVSVEKHHGLWRHHVSPLSTLKSHPPSHFLFTRTCDLCSFSSSSVQLRRRRRQVCFIVLSCLPSYPRWLSACLICQPDSLPHSSSVLFL